MQNPNFLYLDIELTNDLPSNPALTIVAGIEHLATNPIKPEVGINYEISKPSSCSIIEDSLISHISKNVEKMFTSKGAVVTEEAERWIRSTVKDLITEVVQEL